MFSYNITSNEWHLFADNTSSTHWSGGIGYYNDYIYLFGGLNTSSNKIEYTSVDRDNEIFLVSNYENEITSDYILFSTVVLPNGIVYLIGGYVDGVRQNSIHVYDTIKDIAYISSVTINENKSSLACNFFPYDYSIWCFGGSLSNNDETNKIEHSNALDIITHTPTSGKNHMIECTANFDCKYLFIRLFFNNLNVCFNANCFDDNF